MKNKFLPSNIQAILLQLLLAVVITASVISLPLDFIEAPLFDLKSKLSFKPSADERIVLITIDEQTLNQYNELNPLPLSYHQQAIQKLEEHQVKAVGYLVDFNRVNRIDSNSFESEMADETYRSMVRLNAQGIPLVLGLPFDLNGEVSPPHPFQKLPQAVALVHRDGTIFGKDKVTRRGLLTLNEKPAFELSLAEMIQNNNVIKAPPGTYRSTEADAEYFLIQFHDRKEKTDDEEDVFTYQRYSFMDLIAGQIPFGELKDKIVLVGTYQKENPNDFTLVNNNYGSSSLPKILVHANVLDSILNQQGIREAGFPIRAMITFILSLMIILISIRVRPSRLILLSIQLLVGTLVLSYLLIQPIPLIGSYWLRIASPLVALALSFYLMIPMRLYSEHRKRYALEKENKMLIEVEEMKTNFLQLVTHDLKTPIAKIQGLTEALQRSLADRMEPKDHELMSHILSANQELNRFINSILELSRIDTQGVNVHLQSKDINQLLEQVILKLRFVAQSKRIQILTEFEPLFPIKIDVELIGKVLSNLIDNAIKYSAEDKTVFIHTREVGDFIEILVKDQGIGISKTDQQHLFGRFHRVKNEETQKIKGSGLGLYLSKYFIESHGGSISVKSEPGEGTEFKILLPIELDEASLPSIQPQTPKNSPFLKETYHA